MKNSVLAVAVAVSVLAGSGSARAITAGTPAVHGHDRAIHGQFTLMGFRDRPEADLLRRAYHILATGDHDYKGRRVKAMEAVKAAGHLLGLDLAGDDRDHEKQVLSDDRLREARDLLQRVLGAAEVKAEKRVDKHLRAAIGDIDAALKIR